MATVQFLLFLLISFLTCVNTNTTNQKRKSKAPKNVDYIRDIMDLLGLDKTSFIRSNTKRNETQCDQDLTAWFNDLRRGEKWALRMLDVQAKPEAGLLEGNRVNLGNFDGCLNLTTPYNFTGQYCLLSINTTQSVFNESQTSMLYFPELNYGICVPSSCTREYVVTLIKNLELPFLKQNISQHLHIDITDGNCQKLNDQLPFTTLNWFTISVLALIITLSIIGTIYEKCKEKSANSLLSAFSLIENAKLIFSSKKSDSNRNTSIDGLRGISNMAIVWNSSLLLQTNRNVQNGVFLYSHMHQDKLSLLFQASFNFVDSFLLLSGVLTVVKFLNIIESRKKYDPAWEIIKRFFRYAIPIALLLLIRIGISEHFHQGPVYHEFNEYHRRNCRSSILQLLFCYDNLATTSPSSCFPHLWNISLDLQLFIFSQIILITAIWKRDAIWKLSLACCITIAVLEFIIGYIYNLAPSVALLATNSNYEIDYAMPHMRGAPWFLGMLLGYFIVAYKDYLPTKELQLVMWISSILAVLIVYFGISYFNYETYTQPSAALYLSGHKLLWGFATAWIIYTLYAQIAAPVEKIFSYGLFSFCGGISFELYLVHMPLIQFLTAIARESNYVSVERSLYHFFPIMLFSIILAVLLALFVTVPYQKITYILTKSVKILPINNKKKSVVKYCSLNTN